MSLLFIKTPALSDEGPPLQPHLTFVTSLKALSPNTVILEFKASLQEFTGRGNSVQQGERLAIASMGWASGQGWDRKPSPL